MRKILLLSDTHGFVDEKIAKYASEADEIWHAGDVGTIEVIEKLQRLKPVKGVYGNIDGQEIRKIFPKNLLFQCEEVKVFITHIGGYPGRYSPDARKMINSEKPQLFICGHSHILKVMYDNTHHLLHLNPGACGMQGFHLVKTLLRFCINKKEIKNLEVIELGKRA